MLLILLNLKSLKQNRKKTQLKTIAKYNRFALKMYSHIRTRPTFKLNVNHTRNERKRVVMGLNTTMFYYSTPSSSIIHPHPYTLKITSK